MTDETGRDARKGMGQLIFGLRIGLEETMILRKEREGKEVRARLVAEAWFMLKRADGEHRQVVWHGRRRGKD